MYGFRKENKEKKTKYEEYRHEGFRRGEREKLGAVTRKKKTGPSTLLKESREAKDQGTNNMLMLEPFAQNLVLKKYNYEELDFIKPEIIADVRFD